jgi:hypothetical protein
MILFLFVRNAVRVRVIDYFSVLRLCELKYVQNRFKYVQNRFISRMTSASNFKLQYLDVCTTLFTFVYHDCAKQ